MLQDMSFFHFRSMCPYSFVSERPMPETIPQTETDKMSISDLQHSTDASVEAEYQRRSGWDTVKQRNRALAYPDSLCIDSFFKSIIFNRYSDTDTVLRWAPALIAWYSPESVSHRITSLNWYFRRDCHQRMLHPFVFSYIQRLYAAKCVSPPHFVPNMF
jgi:hypothetical protein